MFKIGKAARLWDMGAVTLSSICMLHCLGLPLLTAVLPIISLSHEGLHVAMVLLAVPVTAWVVLSEMAARGNEFFIGAATTGICLMLAAVAVPALEAYETVLTLVGGTLLAGAHLWRWYHHQPRFPAVNDDV